MTVWSLLTILLLKLDTFGSVPSLIPSKCVPMLTKLKARKIKAFDHHR